MIGQEWRTRGMAYWKMRSTKEVGQKDEGWTKTLGNGGGGGDSRCEKRR